MTEVLFFRDEPKQGTSKAIHSPHQDTPPKYFEHHEETGDQNPFHKCVELFFRKIHVEGSLKFLLNLAEV